MIDRFFDCLPFILAREGGKTDIPGDRGGRTAFGITQATFNDWTHGVRDVWTITQEEVAAIYHARYWDACQCGKLPKGLDLAVFDSAVQHGPRNAIRFLQRAVGITADGAFGPGTLGALAGVATAMLPELIAEYLEQRQDFYNAIVEHDPTQDKFAHGWANRLAALNSEVGATA